MVVDQKNEKDFVDSFGRDSLKLCLHGSWQDLANFAYSEDCLATPVERFKKPIQKSTT